MQLPGADKQLHVSDLRTERTEVSSWERQAEGWGSPGQVVGLRGACAQDSILREPWGKAERSPQEGHLEAGHASSQPRSPAPLRRFPEPCVVSRASYFSSTWILPGTMPCAAVTVKTEARRYRDAATTHPPLRRHCVTAPRRLSPPRRDHAPVLTATPLRDRRRRGCRPGRSPAGRGGVEGVATPDPLKWKRYFLRAVGGGKW